MNNLRITGILGFRSLWIDGIPQSGGLYNKIWKKVLHQLESRTLNNILMLGLGGGTAAKHLLREHPQAHITAVEINPEVVGIAKRHFLSLRELGKLNIVTEDAKIWVKKDTAVYDLIVVDLYLQNHNPPFARTKTFLKKIKNRLATKGCIVYNAAHPKDHEAEFTALYETCLSCFTVKTLHKGYEHHYLLLE